MASPLDQVDRDLELLGLVRMPRTMVPLTLAYRMAVGRAKRRSKRGKVTKAELDALQAAYYRLLERV